MILGKHSEYLQESVIPLRLACTDSAGWPAVLSLWFTYHNKLIYCATQGDAKVVRYLRNEPRCGFEIAADQPPYCGIRGRAIAKIVPELGENILLELLERYLGGTESPLAKKLLQKSETEVAICLNPESVHTWNFRKRMSGSVHQPVPKVCPDKY
jgi:hypothetical protein